MIQKVRKACMKPIRKKYILMCVCMGMTELLSVSTIWGVGFFINQESAVGSIGEAKSLMLFLLGLVCIEFFLKYIAQHLNFQNSNILMISMQGEVREHLMYADYAMLAQRDSIGMTQQINNDCVTVSDYYIEKMPKLVCGYIKVAILSMLIAICSWEVFVVLLVLVSLYYLIYLYGKKTYKARNQRMLSAMSDFFALLGGQLLNIFLIKINSWYEKSRKNFEKEGDAFIRTSVKFLDFDYWLNNILSAISIIMLVLIPFFLSPKAAGAGTFVVVITYVQMLLPYLQELMETVKFSMQNKNALERLDELLTIRPERTGEKEIPEISEIRIKNIDFHYTNSEKQILKDFSFYLERGKLYLIKGENGAGKTTLLNLLLGIYTPDVGAIFYNGENMEVLDVLKLREKHISFCEQEPYLIKGTILENLNGERPDTKLLDFIDKLEHGYETFVDSKASNLSGGQRQRIALARALSRKAELYILDEPTNALDVQAIELLKEELQKKKKDAIVVMVTHDVQMLSLADEVISL